MNKETSLADAVAELRDGMVIGIGGWGARRKPMALVRQILRSDLKDLTLVGFGGPEVGMLCAAGKVRKLIYGFVSLDHIPLEPYFRKAREAAAVEINEYDEGMFLIGLRAAAERVPFAPTRIGIGTDVLTYNPHLKMVNSPYGDGEALVAVPAIRTDVSLVHVSRADRFGNVQTDGPDPYFDNLIARAADKVIASTESLCDRMDVSHPDTVKSSLFDRTMVQAVVNAPLGAHPTTAHDAYGWDMAHLKAYGATAREDDGWARYMQDFVADSEAAYLDNVGGADAVARLPIPQF
ncbi:CoA transferase subunit A [Oceanibium sediminis]|uniref:CoA transferase subunit A n=1 Tax=Oceanibium sediminis TaxID=2026339 RepID=UPI000DD34A73|nr:CoA-transferase [Oceanibium sediminis]